MREITIYEACDGEQFDSKDECLEYEYCITHLPPCLHLYDEMLNELLVGEYENPNDALDDIENICYEAQYMVVLPSEDMRQQLEFSGEHFGFPDFRIEAPGIWKFDTCWRKLTLEEIYDCMLLNLLNNPGLSIDIEREKEFMK